MTTECTRGPWLRSLCDLLMWGKWFSYRVNQLPPFDLSPFLTWHSCPIPRLCRRDVYQKYRVPLDICVEIHNPVRRGVWSRITQSNENDRSRYGGSELPTGIATSDNQLWPCLATMRLRNDTIWCYLHVDSPCHAFVRDQLIWSE